jgi:hypothetical protein
LLSHQLGPHLQGQTLQMLELYASQVVSGGGIWVGPSPSTGPAITASNTAHASLTAAVAVVGPGGSYRVKAHRW